MISPVEVVEAQAKVISIQAGVIDELLKTLIQQMGADEVDRLPSIQRLNEAAAIIEDYDLPY